MKFLCANRIAPDGVPHSAVSHLGLCCLPMSHKKDARLIRVQHGLKQNKFLDKICSPFIFQMFMTLHPMFLELTNYRLMSAMSAPRLSSIDPPYPGISKYTQDRKISLVLTVVDCSHVGTRLGCI